MGSQDLGLLFAWGENSATLDGVHAAFAAGARLIVYAGVLTFFRRAIEDAICVTRHVATEASSAATTGAPT